MGILAKPLGWLLTWIYGLIGSYGWSLVILTIVVKAALYPVYAKSIKSTSRMSDLQPKIQEIQQKYAKDKALMNQKIQELYKEENVSPSAGCLPMVIQMIVIMGLFTLLRQPMNYMNDDMLFAIHESFLWIKDLAQPDMWILPIGSGVATFVAYSMSNSGLNAGQSQGMSKIMKYIFPIMILWMARSYPSGLAIYWFMSQVIQIFYNIKFAKDRKKDALARKQAKKSK